MTEPSLTSNDPACQQPRDEPDGDEGPQEQVSDQEQDEKPGSLQRDVVIWGR